MRHIRAACAQAGDGHAALVDIHIAHRKAVFFVNARNFHMAGVFHGKNVRPPKELHDEVVKVFRACADDDLLRRNAHAAELEQIGRDRFPQLYRAVCGRCGKQLRFPARKLIPKQA